MKLKYKARTKNGELQTGFIETATREAAVSILTGHELFILSLESAENKHWYDRILGLFNRVGAKDLMVFTRQFATLLEAKIPLGESLRTMEKQTRNPILKSTVFEVTSDIDAGLSLSQSLEKYTNIFSSFYVSLVRSAEITGRMEETIGFLAEYLEKEVGLVSRVRNALIYPVVVIVLFFIVAGLMTSVVLPNIAPIFEEAGVELPVFTKVLIAGGEFLASWWWALAMVLAAVGLLIADYLRTDEGRVVVDELIIRLPVFGKLLRYLYIARFSESMSILIKGGIPIAQTLEITSNTIGSTIYRDLLHGIAEDVRRGELMSTSLSQNEEFFPPLVGQMVAIGEATGRLEELLSRVSAFYTREVDSLVGNLVELIQPALMIVIGLLVAGLFASILIPIYDLAKTF